MEVPNRVSNLFYADAEVGIGFTVGSLSTLRPLFSHASGRGSGAQEAYEVPEIDRRRRTAITDAEHVGAPYSESKEDLVQDILLVGKG